MNTEKKFRIHISGDKLVLLAANVAVFILFTALNKNFLTVANMINILIAASLVGLVAVGHTYLIIAGQNDLSRPFWSERGSPFSRKCFLILCELSW